MGRIEWSRLSGEECETLIAMLLCCIHPLARRVRPSQGDGGIDVLVPHPDGSVDVFQIKRHHEKLTSDQKFKIKKSLRRAQDNAAANGLLVASWTLVTPMTPTDQEWAWFDQLTADTAFDTDWKDMTHIETWVATHPAMADYYLHHGQDRLNASLRHLGAWGRTDRGIERAELGGPALAPADTVDGLHGLFRVINDLDPFYTYEFEITERLPDRARLLRDPALAFATSYCIDGEGWVTCRVYPRFAAALQERPIAVDLTLDLSGNQAAVHAVNDWLRYGAALPAPIPAVDIQASLPGGFDSPPHALISLFPVHADRPTQPLRLQLLDPADQVMAETRIVMEPATFGLDGQGIRAPGSEHKGAFDLEIRADLAEQRTWIRFLPADVTGKAPGDLLAGIRVLRELRAPQRLRFAPAFGPIDDTLTTFKLSAPDGPASAFCDLVDSLALIQEHTTHQIVMPALNSLPDDVLHSISLAARLLRGEKVITRHEEVRLTEGDAANIEAGAYALTMDGPLLVSLNGATLDLGTMRTYVSAVNAQRIQSRPDAPPQLLLTPFNGDCLTLTRQLVRASCPGAD
jgi:hypothetical protein